MSSLRAVTEKQGEEDGALDSHRAGPADELVSTGQPLIALRDAARAQGGLLLDIGVPAYHDPNDSGISR